MRIENMFINEENEKGKNGQQAVWNAANGYLRLQDGESARVFLLTTQLPRIKQHVGFKQGIKTHTCRDPKHGKGCYSCRVGVPTQVRTIVVLYNVDEQVIQVFYATDALRKDLKAFIDEYEEDALSTPLVISRKGAGLDTRYSIMPARVRLAERELFKVPEGIVVNDDTFWKILNVLDDEKMKELVDGRI